jgi:hypothetical protein
MRNRSCASVLSDELDGNLALSDSEGEAEIFRKENL